MANFFNAAAAHTYDEKNRALAPMADAMHFLIRLILADLPPQSRVLCVGVGTGAEIFSLAKEYPALSFVGVDPSEAMLEVCKERLEKENLGERCELIHGYVEDVPTDIPFAAVLSILVGHFIKKEERVAFYQNIHHRLLKGGIFINTELSFDVASSEFPHMLKEWEKVQRLMGATPESIASLPRVLTEVLTVLPPAEVENSICASGFLSPIQFFQSLMIRGWYAKKE